MTSLCTAFQKTHRVLWLCNREKGKASGIEFHSTGLLTLTVPGTTWAPTPMQVLSQQGEWPALRGKVLGGIMRESDMCSCVQIPWEPVSDTHRSFGGCGMGISYISPAAMAEATGFSKWKSNSHWNPKPNSFSWLARELYFRKMQCVCNCAWMTLGLYVKWSWVLGSD